MISMIEAIILGIVQGITEWLPVSSSGHLVLFQHFFGLAPPVSFDIMLHLGSLIVVLTVFWKDILKLAKGVLKREKASLKMLAYLAIASIPIALVGFFLNDLIKSIFNSLLTVGLSLLFTAVLLFISRYPKKKNKKLGIKNTFLIGIAQAIAILPGVSRSGSTISTGLVLGIKKEDVARFSFLMFIPAILGASLLEIKDVVLVTDLPAAVVGTITAMVVGFFSLKLLLNLINKNKFSNFAWYCLVLGIITLILALV